MIFHALLFFVDISTYGGIKIVSGDVLVYVPICYTVVNREL
jgi:hypothetical protein